MQEPKRSRIKSFRFDVGTIEKLDRAAKRARVTENAFLNDLLTRRLMFDPLVPAFQEVTLSQGTFQSILGVTSVEALEEAASQAAQKNVPLVYELYESNGKTLSFQEFVTDILGKHGGWFELEGNVNLTHGWVTLRHGYGLKWSRFLRAYLLSAHETFSNDVLNVKVSDQFVRISFKAKPGEDR